MSVTVAMNSLYFALVVFSLAIYCNGELSLIDGKVKIKVHTDANCGDTIRFFTQQVPDAYEKYKDNLEFDFVAWGRTQIEAGGSYRCLHGIRGCWANRVHRCSLNLLGNNHDAKTRYMICEFNSNSQTNAFQGSYYCAANLNVDLIELDTCVISSTYDYLDSHAQAETTEVLQTVNFIPAVVFNDEPDFALHNQALNRLSSMICFALASESGTGETNCQI